MQGLRCVHGAAVMEPRLRQVLEGLIPASAGPREQGAHGGTGAEVLTEAEWRDLSRVSSMMQDDWCVQERWMCWDIGWFLEMCAFCHK